MQKPDLSLYERIDLPTLTPGPGRGIELPSVDSQDSVSITFRHYAKQRQERLAAMLQAMNSTEHQGK